MPRLMFGPNGGRGVSYSRLQSFKICTDQQILLGGCWGREHIKERK